MLTSNSKSRGLIDTKVNYWPSLVDLMAAVVSVLVLVNVVQFAMLDDPEAARAREAQLSLMRAFEARFSDASESIDFQLHPNLLQISFSQNLLFPSGGFELGSRGRSIMRRCAEVLLDSKIQYEQIQVEGHTDSDPFRDPQGRQYPRNNWELSGARALSVLNALLSVDIPAQRLSATGYGDTRPVPNAPKERSRRIELRILFVTPNAGWTR